MTDKLGTHGRPILKRTPIVIVSVARQSRSRSNGGPPTFVQPHRDSRWS